jgi:signal transduction histidine kinase
VLNSSGLVAAIEWQASEFRNRSGIAVELVMPGEPVDADDTFALAAYRITQECLTNIAKHAQASKVQIEMKTDGRFLDLTIHDNGRGLPGKINAGSHGIFGMIERARYLGGSMEIGSKDGTGTTAHLSLPLTAARV